MGLLISNFVDSHALHIKPSNVLWRRGYRWAPSLGFLQRLDSRQVVAVHRYLKALVEKDTQCRRVLLAAVSRSGTLHMQPFFDFTGCEMWAVWTRSGKEIRRPLPALFSRDDRSFPRGHSHHQYGVA